MLKARSGLCMYRVLFIAVGACSHVTMVTCTWYLSADRGVHATCFYSVVSLYVVGVVSM